MKAKEKNFITISYTIRPRQVEAISQLAELNERSASAVLRMIIDAYFIGAEAQIQRVGE